MHARRTERKFKASGDAKGCCEDDHRMWELAGQCAPRGWTEAKEAVGLAANFVDESLDRVVKPAAQLGRGGSVMLHRLGVFVFRLGMKDVRLHRPMILRMRADTSSPGIP
jgi:hypothetical protein